MTGIDPKIARRTVAVINEPWRTDINDIAERKMVKKMENVMSDLYSVYRLIFDYKIVNDGSLEYAESKVELAACSKKHVISLGTIISACIVNGYLELTVTDIEGNDTVMKIKIRCD